MMVFSYINRLFQFDQTSITLLLSDDAQAFPDQRVDKQFIGNPSDDDLLAAAQSDYDLAMSGILDG